MGKAEPAWGSVYVAHLRTGEIDLACALLDELRTGHAGTPPQQVKLQAVRLIERGWASDPSGRLDLALALAAAPSPAAREIGATLLPALYSRDTTLIDPVLVALGDDPHWEVREWVGFALARIVAADIDALLPRLSEWCGNASGTVRRMVTVACGFAMRDVDATGAESLLKVLAGMASDTDPYVRKNLGPFALGSYALKHHAEAVRAWVDTLDLADAGTAWNLAMMFTTAEGAKRAGEFAGLLRSLAADERPAVHRAVTSVRKNLDRRGVAWPSG